MSNAHRLEAVPPYFSVVIPTYRRDDLLREALASVRAQTYDDFEVIVVDDDPTSDTASVVREVGDERFRYVRNDHRSGGAGTRNAGIDRAAGRWIAFLDDDDAWLPTMLERQREAIDASPHDLGLVYTGRLKVDAERDRVLERSVPSERGWIVDVLMRGNVIGGFSGVAIRADLLREVGALDERFPSLQDIDLYVRIAERAAVEVVREPLVRVRRGAEERISGNAHKKLVGNALFAEKYRERVVRDPVLRHRSAGHRFVYALAAGRYGTMAGAVPWTLAGIVVDPSNLKRVAIGTARSLRERLAPRRTRSDSSGGGR